MHQAGSYLAGGNGRGPGTGDAGSGAWTSTGGAIIRRYLTRVRLISLPERCKLWLRFGHPISEAPHSRYQRYAYFVPHAVFATLRWHGNEYGTILWQLTILRAVAPWEAASKIADVDPGAEVLLRVSGKENIRRVLSLIHGIQSAKIEPTAVNPDYWRTVQNRLIAREFIPEYSVEEHGAYLRRLRVMG